MRSTEILSETPQGGPVVGLELGERRIEELRAGQHDQIEPGPALFETEELPDQTLEPVPSHRVAQPPRRDDAQPARVPAVRQAQHRQVASAAPDARSLHLQKFRPAADPVPAGQCPDQVTASRLRPFARRFFRMRRPLLVLMRVRNPCVRFRRRRFGWYVRFMASPAVKTSRSW